jgi:hypothetical protein
VQSQRPFPDERSGYVRDTAKLSFEYVLDGLDRNAVMAALMQNRDSLRDRLIGSSHGVLATPPADAPEADRDEDPCLGRLGRDLVGGLGSDDRGLTIRDPARFGSRLAGGSDIDDVRRCLCPQLVFHPESGVAGVVGVGALG